MRCPICKNEMGRRWMENHQNEWWTGLWNCESCGDIKMSGDFNGRIWNRTRVIHWTPSCPKCGYDNVTACDKECTSFLCWGCSRKMEVRNNKLIVTQTWIPTKITLKQGENFHVVSTQN